ncbi:MAG: class I mannose-6-phosphate isomerase [Clostridia bacterium]|nr:class I mannose-6-phosphate isomerase [Clostridia bacterium]
MMRYPLLLRPIAKTALWGGNRLRTIAPDAPFDKISEIWALSVRADDNSVILNGPHAGQTLREYLGHDRPFPLLIKFIDACDKLSVQVHPDDAAAALEGDQGKTEMWHILQAEPGAELIYGLKEGCTAADFKAAVAEKNVDRVLHHQPVKAGETYFIPAGMVHGIGAGILVAEIQQNSDLTYRVYDYDRIGPDGKLRPLHTEKAMEVTKEFTAEETHALQFEAGEAGLVNCRYFGVFRHDAPYTGNAEAFEILLVTDGAGYITYKNEKIPLKAGDCCYLPAEMGGYKISEGLTLLRAKEN